MASIVRIKRRLEDEPAEALLLAPSSKKLKEDVSVDQKVLKFFGTIDSKVTCNQNSFFFIQTVFI